MIGPGIAALLESDTACAAVIGPIVYPLLLPTKAPLPAATYQVISDVPTYTLDGLIYSQARVQIDGWGAAYGDAGKAAAAIRAVLERYEGTLPNGLIVGSLIVDNGPLDYYEPVSLLYRAQTDYLVLYSQPTTL